MSRFCSLYLPKYIADGPPVSFSIDSVRDIEWSDSAFQSLVLPAKQKELVLAFAESQVKYKGAFDDVIQGKGLFTWKMIPPLSD